jgi:putative ABC transport system permease protein
LRNRLIQIRTGGWSQCPHAARALSQTARLQEPWPSPKGEHPTRSLTVAYRSSWGRVVVWLGTEFLHPRRAPDIDFEWRDNSRALRVTILSQSLARRLFGNADPLGQRVRVGLDPSRDALEVIGVVADARLYDLKSPDVFAAYTPALQDRNASFKCFVIRGDHVSFAALKEAVESLGRERVGDVVTLQYITDRSLLLERLTAMMSSFFGALVLLLTGVGLFGLMSYVVAQRRREIGIRMALGADRPLVVWQIVREGLMVTLAGLAVGTVAALATVRVVKTLLFGVTPQDPLTLVGAGASLLAVAILACALPASRAARVDPMIALRAE